MILLSPRLSKTFNSVPIYWLALRLFPAEISSAFRSVALLIHPITFDNHPIVIFLSFLIPYHCESWTQAAPWIGIRQKKPYNSSLKANWQSSLISFLFKNVLLEPFSTKTSTTAHWFYSGHYSVEPACLLIVTELESFWTTNTKSRT